MHMSWFSYRFLCISRFPCNFFEDTNQRSSHPKEVFLVKVPHWEAPLVPESCDSWELSVISEVKKTQTWRECLRMHPKNPNLAPSRVGHYYFFSRNFGYYSLEQDFFGVCIKLLMSAMKSSWCDSKVKLIATFVFWILSTHHGSAGFHQVNVASGGLGKTTKQHSLSLSISLDTNRPWFLFETGCDFCLEMVLPGFAISVFNEWQVLPRAAETARMLGLDVSWAPGPLHARKPISQWPLICWSGWISCLIPASTYLETRIDCCSWKGMQKKTFSLSKGFPTQVECFVQRISIPRGGIVAWMKMQIWLKKRCWGLSHFCTSQVCAWFCIVSDQKFDFLRC